ncbi:MAG: hypothetical protein M1833_002828 [Piccolia ochrophora]|nr:MAG: hypothetical protein M1833_002828 [Piccolia ochrophora]
MATTESPARPHERHFRKRPFSSLMRRLTNLKSSSSDQTNSSSTKKNAAQSSKPKKSSAHNNNSPYSQSAQPNGNDSTSVPGRLAFASQSPVRTGSVTTYDQAENSVRSSLDDRPPQTSGSRSAAPTVSTNPDPTLSDTAHSTNADSAAGTNATAGGATSLHGGGGSTFSSPAPSVRSLTTTLTTIQSTAPSNLLPGGSTSTQAPANPSSVSQVYHPSSHTPTTHFSHQFPSSPPASAVPTHLAPQVTGGGNPSTYSAATANNLLTDNASILTLASSSKRQRRQSLDTNASVRALAPSSLFGGSRESLPLSVLSGNATDPPPSSAGIHQGRPSVGGITSAERASVYSAAGIVPALSSERNSYYAGKQNHDGGSIKSGLLGHGRNDSITGSIGGASAGPLASPREISGSGSLHGMSERMSRRDSGWGDVSEGLSVGGEGKGKGKDREKEGSETKLATDKKEKD